MDQIPVCAYTSRQVKEDPTSIFQLMKSYLPTGWGMTTGLPVESSFDRDTYNSFSGVIHPAAIAASLQLIYGEELATPNYHLPRERASGKALSASIYVRL